MSRPLLTDLHSCIVWCGVMFLQERGRKLYCEQLQQMMADREQQRRREREWEIEAERKVSE